MLVQLSADLMRNPVAFQNACEEAMRQWPNSTAAAMTTPSMNYQAWVGHAASTIALGCPEELTRRGWRLLNEEEQELANLAAQNAIDKWRDANA